MEKHNWLAFTMIMMMYENDSFRKPLKSQRPTNFQWDDLREGYTLAILYAEKHQFLDSRIGFRVVRLLLLNLVFFSLSSRSI